MSKTPLDYKEWVQQNIGKEGFYEAPFMLDVIRHEEGPAAVRGLELALRSMSGYMNRMGMRVTNTHVAIAADVALHAKIVNLIANAEFQGTPEQYVAYVYECWLEIRREWENKSLWGYLSHWFMRILPRKIRRRGRSNCTSA